MSKLIIILLALSPTLFVGCASITGTTGQSISVETRDEAGVVSGANCEMSNAKGKWFLTTPGSVQIRRSNDDMMVICQKEGLQPGTASVVSDTKGSMAGNILLGGGIGAIVDHNTGAAYEYPSLIQVVMGRISQVNGKPTTNASIQSSATQSTSLQSTIQASNLNPSVPEKINPLVAREKCTELGFQPSTEQFGKCVIQLSK